VNFWPNQGVTAEFAGLETWPRRDNPWISIVSSLAESRTLETFGMEPHILTGRSLARVEHLNLTTAGNSEDGSARKGSKFSRFVQLCYPQLTKLVTKKLEELWACVSPDSRPSMPKADLSVPRDASERVIDGL